MRAKLSMNRAERYAPGYEALGRTLDKQVQVSVTQPDWQNVRRAAAAENQSVAQFLRDQMAPMLAELRARYAALDE